MTDYLYDLPNATSGIDTIGVQLISAVPSFTYMILFFVFIIVTIGGIIRQNMRRGNADYPLWFTIGAMATFFVALLMSVISGIIDLTALVITTVILIFCSVWFFLDQRQSEI